MRAEITPESLTDLDKWQMAWYIASWVGDFEEAYRQFSLGTIPESALISRTHNMNRLRQTSGVREVWELLLTQADPRFATWASSHVNEA